MLGTINNNVGWLVLLILFALLLIIFGAQLGGLIALFVFLIILIIFLLFSWGWRI